MLSVNLRRLCPLTSWQVLTNLSEFVPPVPLPPEFYALGYCKIILGQTQCVVRLSLAAA